MTKNVNSGASRDAAQGSGTTRETPPSASAHLLSRVELAWNELKSRRRHSQKAQKLETLDS